MDILKERYEIQKHLEQRLGQQTLLALDRKTQDLVLVKLLTFGGDLKWEIFRLFEREAKILQELEHPNIPRYLDYFDVETNFGKGFALIQSYIDAPSLEEHIKAGRKFNEKELQQIAKAILNILIYLHSNSPSVIHRDIKPGNVLLTNSSDNSLGQIYLIDFGSVQATVTEEGNKTIVGTYGYMPPEQFGERAVPASDLYSLGATIIYLASGQHPAELPQKDFRLSFKDYVNLSPTFIDWLQWMTQPILERRLKSASEALEALENKTPQNKYGSIPPKPTNSRVVLTKETESLQICIPSQGFRIDLLPQIGFAIIWNGFLINWYCIALSTWNSGGWFAAFFALGHLGVGIWLIWKILFTLYGRILLLINKEKIYLRYGLFDFTYDRPSPALRNQITKLELTKTCFKKGDEGEQVRMKPQINIWAGTKKFVIGKGLFGSTGIGLLCRSELDWLAHELSEWLDLPITQDQ